MLDYTIHFVVSLIGGTFGTLIGGCSLITVPTLIFLGLPADVAIATNRFGLTGMSLIGWREFHRQGQVDYKLGLLLAIPALFGAALGAVLMLSTDEIALEKIIGAMSLLVLLAVSLNRKAGLEVIQKQISNRHRVLAIVISFLLGIYGGYYGAAFGTFLSLLLILMFGQTFIQSAATRKITMSLVCILASAIFMWNHVVDYSFAITQFVGMGAGSLIGARLAGRIGNLWIRRAFLVIAFVMAIKLFV